MKTSVWIYLLNVFLAGSIWAIVTDVKVYKNPENVVEGNTIKITCNGTCSNGTCQQVTNSVLTNVRRNASKTVTCTVKDTGDQTTGSNTTTFDIYYGPDVVSITPNQNGEIDILEGTTTSVQCSWKNCHPISMCSITWKKSGTKLKTITGVSNLLLFDSQHKVNRTNAGSYKCEAARAEKVIADELNIIVQYGPDDVNIIQSNNLPIQDKLEVVEGETTAKYSIMCKRGQCSGCNLNWTGPAEVPRTDTHESLPLFAQSTTFSRNNSGKFECTANNIYSNKVLNASFQLAVKYGPDDVNIIQSNNLPIQDKLEVVEGENTAKYSIMCKRGQCSGCNLNWTGPAGVPRTDTHESLPLFAQSTTFSRNNSGKFECTAKNIYSNKVLNASFQLAVKYGPDDVNIIQSNNLPIQDKLEVVEGENTAKYSIMCKRGQCSGCNLNWTGPAGVPHTVTHESLPLFAQSTTFSRNNSGKFECMAKNIDSNKVLKATFQLAVQYGPDDVNISQSNNLPIQDKLEVVEGENTAKYSIMCKRGQCSGCNLNWTGPAEVPRTVTHESLPLFAQSTTFSRNNSGKFECMAKNIDSNKVLKATFQLTVQYSPDVSLTWTYSSKTFTCAPSGVPTTYTFYDLQQWIGDNLIRSNIPLKVTNNKGSYRFSSNSYQDTGIYKCVVNNGIRSGGLLNKTGERSIVIQDKPVIVKSKANYTVSKGDPLNMSLDVYAEPDVQTVELLNETQQTIHSGFTSHRIKVKISVHNTQAEVDGKKITLNITNVREEYFNTTLTIRITNKIDKEMITVRLIPKGAPDVPGNFSLAEKTHNSVKFKVVSGFYNGAPQTLVILYRKPGNNSEWTNGTSKEAGTEKDNLYELDIHGLDPEATYEFKAYAFNEYAKSSYTEVITETLNATPFPVAIVVGTLGGVLFLTIIILVIVFMVRKHKDSTKDKDRSKNFKNEELVSSIAMSPTYGISPTYANNDTLMDSDQDTDGNMDTDSADHRNYENTTIGYGKSTQPDAATSRPESVIYQNTQGMTTFGSQKSRNESTKSTDPSMAQYIELTGGPAEKVEEASYLSMNEAKALTENTEHATVKKEDSLDNGYLDMNESKALVEKTRLARLAGESNYANTTPIFKKTSQGNKNSPSSKARQVNKSPSDYTNMQFPTEDYENVEKKMSPPSKQPSRGAQYKERESVPEYDAPPPPIQVPGETENYMNVRIQRSRYQ